MIIQNMDIDIKIMLISQLYSNLCKILEIWQPCNIDLATLMG